MSEHYGGSINDPEVRAAVLGEELGGAVDPSSFDPGNPEQVYYDTKWAAEGFAESSEPAASGAGESESGESVSDEGDPAGFESAF